MRHEGVGYIKHPLLFLLLLLFFLLTFQNRVLLYSPACPGTQSVNQSDLELRDTLVSASYMLVSKACISMLGSLSILAPTVPSKTIPCHDLCGRCHTSYDVPL